MASITMRNNESESKVLPEKSARRTNDQSATELTRRRRKIFPLLGATGGDDSAGGGRVGSDMGKNWRNYGRFDNRNFQKALCKAVETKRRWHANERRGSVQREGGLRYLRQI